MTKLVCSQCGNKDRFDSVVVSEEKTTATCGKCGTKVESDSKVFEVKTITRGWKF